MAVADYVTRGEFVEALKTLATKAEMLAMEKRITETFNSRLYTVKGDLIGKIETSEKRILAEIRNGR